MQFTTLALSALAGLAAAATNLDTIASQMPSCSQSCLLQGATAAGCGSTDYACQCDKTDTVTSNSSACIMSSCSVTDISSTLTPTPFVARTPNNDGGFDISLTLCDPKLRKRWSRSFVRPSAPALPPRPMPPSRRARAPAPPRPRPAPWAQAPVATSSSPGWAGLRFLAPWVTWPYECGLAEHALVLTSLHMAGIDKSCWTWFCHTHMWFGSDVCSVTGVFFNQGVFRGWELCYTISCLKH